MNIYWIEIFQQLITHVQIMTFFWNAIVSDFKRTVIEEMIVQLVDDLKSTFPDSLIDIKNPQDFYYWHNLVDRVVENDIAWKIICAQFDQKKY